MYQLLLFIGLPELILIFVGGLFFIGLIFCAISLGLYILKKTKANNGF